MNLIALKVILQLIITISSTPKTSCFIIDDQYKIFRTKLLLANLNYNNSELHVNNGIEFINAFKSTKKLTIHVTKEIILDKTISTSFKLITENKTIKFTSNGIVTFKDGFKFDFNGYILSNKNDQIFNIDQLSNTPFKGNLKNDVIYPEWFGAKPKKTYPSFRILINPKNGCNSLYSKHNFHDNYKPIQFALNTAKGRHYTDTDYNHQKFFYGGNKVKLQNGFYPIAKTINIPSGVELYGNGQTKSWITDASECGLDYMITIFPENSKTVAGNIKINNIGFRGLGANSSSKKYWLTKGILKAKETVYNFTIDDCRFEKSNNLIELIDCYGDVKIENSNLSYGINNALTLRRCHSFTIENCRIENTKNNFSNKRSSAIYVYKGQPINILNSIFQFNDAYAIHAFQASQLNITNCYFEDNFISNKASKLQLNNTSINNGSIILSEEALQINITNNTFTLEREIIVNNKPILLNIAQFIDTRLVQFHGNRITNDIVSNKIQGIKNPAHNIDKVIDVKNVAFNYNTNFFGYSKTSDTKNLREFIIKNNFINTYYTRSLEKENKPDYFSPRIKSTHSPK